jgi:hypothetical protein
MNSLLSRFRWAIALAVLQGVIFSSVCISEHRRNLRYNHKRDSTHIEYFGCFPLSHQRLSSEERWDIVYDCRPAPSIKFVVLANLPVFIIWEGFVGLTGNTNVDQLWSFYAINGLGIPVMWFCIGSLIDRRRLRHATAVLNPPMEQG